MKVTKTDRINANKLLDLHTVESMVTADMWAIAGEMKIGGKTYPRLRNVKLKKQKPVETESIESRIERLAVFYANPANQEARACPFGIGDDDDLTDVIMRVLFPQANVKTYSVSKGGRRELSE